MHYGQILNSSPKIEIHFLLATVSKEALEFHRGERLPPNVNTTKPRTQTLRIKGKKHKCKTTHLHPAWLVSSKCPEESLVHFDPKLRRSAHVCTQNIHCCLLARS